MAQDAREQRFDKTFMGRDMLHGTERQRASLRKKLWKGTCIMAQNARKQSSKKDYGTKNMLHGTECQRAEVRILRDGLCCTKQQKYIRVVLRYTSCGTIQFDFFYIRLQWKRFRQL